MASVLCLPAIEMCLSLLEKPNFKTKHAWSPLKRFTCNSAQIFFLLPSPSAPPWLALHVLLLPSPPTCWYACRWSRLTSRLVRGGSWQATDGCLWSDNNEQAPRQITSGTDRRHRGTKQEDKMQRRPRKTKGSGRCAALWSRQMRESSFDHFIKRNVTVTFSDEDGTKKMCGAKHWWNATQSVSMARLWLRRAAGWESAS